MININANILSKIFADWIWEHTIKLFCINPNIFINKTKQKTLEKRQNIQQSVLSKLDNDMLKIEFIVLLYSERNPCSNTPRTSTQELIKIENLSIYRCKAGLSEQDTISTVIKMRRQNMGIHKSRKLLCNKWHHNSSKDANYRMVNIFISYISERGLVSRIYEEQKNWTPRNEQPH